MVSFLVSNPGEVVRENLTSSGPHRSCEKVQQKFHLAGSMPSEDVGYCFYKYLEFNRNSV